jgi:hypothetical protein
MLSRIERFRNLGNINTTYALLNQFIELNVKEINRTNLKSLCIDINRDLGGSFDGLVHLLNKFRFLKNESENIKIDKNISLNKFSNAEYLKTELNNAFFRFLKNSKKFRDLLPIDCFKYNKEKQSTYINKGYIPTKYYPLIHYFITTNFFYYGQSKEIINVNKLYLDTIIKRHQNYSLSKKNRIKMTHNQLIDKLSKQEARGIEAEKFILEFEKIRLRGHDNINKIKIISNVDVGAGYDIISFNSINSKSSPNRLIEVKSFKGNEGFYWSRNEVEVAKSNSEEYVLYIVDYDKMKSEKNYEPKIIRNPYLNVFKSDMWSKEAKNWFLKPLK